MVRATAGTGTDQHLWAKAAELERDFAGYKRRLADRKSPVAEVAGGSRAARGVGGDGEEEEEEHAGGDDDAAAAVGSRGRRYEEYVRRRDERLRHEWRARMQRKEAEVHALWARLDRTGGSRRAVGGGGVDDDRDGELQLGTAATATSHGACREDQVKPPQKPGNLVVKLKPPTPVTPRGNTPAATTAKLARPKTSVPSSLAVAAGSPSARLSTPDPRRRPSHLHREQQPPATPRKENRLPPSSSSAAAAVTPRPRTTTTMLSRSRSMFNKDRGCSSAAVAVAGGESPRPPPRFQPPRSSYDSASRQQPAPAPSPLADAIAAVQSQIISCPPRQQPAVVAVADRKKASAAVAPEPFLVRKPGNGGGVETASSASPAPVVPKHLLPYSYSGEIAPAGCENAEKKSNQQECGDRSSDNKPGSEEMMITGDSDTEPSYVYIKKDSDEQIPRPPPQPATDNYKEYSDSVEEDNMESTGSNEVTPAGGDADEEQSRRRESSESLYSNVQSSFSQRSELDTSPESSNTSAWTTRKSTEVEADAERRVPTPTTPRSSVSVQSPMDAVNGLKRLLTFAKRNGKGSSEAAATAERATLPAAPAGDNGSVSRECPAGGSAKLAVESSDDLDSSYVISPHAHVRSLQSSGPSYPASSEQKEPVLHAKSPRDSRGFAAVVKKLPGSR